jgi:hypothetical protein
MPALSVWTSFLHTGAALLHALASPSPTAPWRARRLLLESRTARATRPPNSGYAHCQERRVSPRIWFCCKSSFCYEPLCMIGILHDSPTFFLLPAFLLFLLSYLRQSVRPMMFPPTSSSIIVSSNTSPST